MRKYELTVIINQNLAEDKRIAFITKVTDLVKKAKGKITATNEWGKKPLAYPIKKETIGYYLNLKMELEPEAAVDLEKKIKLEETIIRHLMLRKD